MALDSAPLGAALLSMKLLHHMTTDKSRYLTRGELGPAETDGKPVEYLETAHALLGVALDSAQLGVAVLGASPPSIPTIAGLSYIWKDQP